MKKKWIAAILLYFALIAVCLIVIYAVPSVKGLLEKTYITEYSKISITDEVSAFIVRDETVYVAGQASEINRLAEPNKLVKAGTRVVELTPIDVESKTGFFADSNSDEKPSAKYEGVLESLGKKIKTTDGGYTKAAGYVTYYVDGAESRLRTSRLSKLKKDDYDALTDLKQIETPKKKCNKGDPIFKVTSNSRWYLVYYVTPEEGEKYYDGATVTAAIGGRDVSVKVAEVKTFKKTNRTRITLSCKIFFDEFFSERHLDTTITLASAEGLLLQDSSIVESGDQKGVFVKNKLGEHKWKPISIKADDGTQCVVYSDLYVDAEGNYVETIATYDEIVAEPTADDLASLEKKSDDNKSDDNKSEDNKSGDDSAGENNTDDNKSDGASDDAGTEG